MQCLLDTNQQHKTQCNCKRKDIIHYAYSTDQLFEAQTDMFSFCFKLCEFL